MREILGTSSAVGGVCDDGSLGEELVEEAEEDEEEEEDGVSERNKGLDY